MIIISGFIWLVVLLLVMFLLPHRVWEMEITWLWWLLILFSVLSIGIIWKTIYPVNNVHNIKKAVLSIFLGFLHIFLCWILYSIDVHTVKFAYFLFVVYIIIRGLGSFLVGYGAYSLANIYLFGL